jgi:hypothetical protein
MLAMAIYKAGLCYYIFIDILSHPYELNNKEFFPRQNASHQLHYIHFYWLVAFYHFRAMNECKALERVL